MDQQHDDQQHGFPCDACGQRHTSGWVGLTTSFFPLLRGPAQPLALCDRCRFRMQRQLHGLA